MFWGPRTPDTWFRWLHLNSLCGATIFGSHQRHLFPPIWQRLLAFGFRVQRVESTMQNLRRVGENSDPILNRLWTKVNEIFRRYRKPLVPSNAFFRLSVSHFVQKIFAIKSRSRRKNGANANVLATNYCERNGSEFSTAICFRATNCPLLGKVWLSSVCWSPSAKPGNEGECRIYRWLVKM